MDLIALCTSPIQQQYGTSLTGRYTAVVQDSLDYITQPCLCIVGTQQQPAAGYPRLLATVFVMYRGKPVFPGPVLPGNDPKQQLVLNVTATRLSQLPAGLLL